MQDQWGRKLEFVRLSLTQACNFSCPYCRPLGVRQESVSSLLSVPEWLVILEAYHLLGCKALRLTGGEPLLYPYVDDLLMALQERAWFQDISMTTNGSLLAERAHRLRSLGLNRVNVSVDSLHPEVFDQCVGKKDQLPVVLAGLEAALDAGLEPVKINTVLTRPWSDEEVLSLLTYAEHKPFIWRFIEYMPFQGPAHEVPSFLSWKKQLEGVVGAELEPVDAVQGFGPATYYRLPSGTLIGFIFSMSHSYCSTCNRVRMTAEGKLRLCLLRDEEVDLLHLLRQGAGPQDLAQCIQNALGHKAAEHDELDVLAPQRPMWRIGG